MQSIENVENILRLCIFDSFGLRFVYFTKRFGIFDILVSCKKSWKTLGTQRDVCSSVPKQATNAREKTPANVHEALQ
ncbi:hypothetical protein CJI52_02860 [Bifidobacteriaceae bacterium WP022]|nr:hypothetical protein CJI52_02860 [Bifidobacteriaceae bacterium WP022]